MSHNSSCTHFFSSVVWIGIQNDKFPSINFFIISLFIVSLAFQFISYSYRVWYRLIRMWMNGKCEWFADNKFVYELRTLGGKSLELHEFEMKEVSFAAQGSTHIFFIGRYSIDLWLTYCSIHKMATNDIFRLQNFSDTSQSLVSENPAFLHEHNT